MEQRKTIANKYAHLGLGVPKAIEIACIKRSSYYYRPNNKRKGKPCSTHTFRTDGNRVDNDVVLESIYDLIRPEYHDYGYHVVTQLLKREGFVINAKKVYRIMKQSHLLHPPTRRSAGQPRQRIKYLVPPLIRPFATIEADIKYVNIHEQNKNAYLLTFLCTFSRYALAWRLDYTMKATHVNGLIKELLNHPYIRQYSKSQEFRIRIRTDNGPQFIAKLLAEELQKNQIDHEFIHPATPQENAHIESFHNTLSRLVCNRNIFRNLDHAITVFSEFYETYNNTRVMESLLYHSPKDFLIHWENDQIAIIRDKNKKQIFIFREKPVLCSDTGSPLEDYCFQNKINTFKTELLTHSEISPI